ncbi:hypothetical protein HXX76_003168 [Chlamydomonas incerta]|uniref:Tetratricopeptide repeat protein n=1 Tax=Chlamydomonas incerta TaxID=51695 RepID=A0A835T9S4_CHLIN|nr:hypothetical protein HXX76_003168 [Chlamydomonas incerta]|eukprot:KAG2441547.1 hypothetical protein HXX76_003168 [Chlamydomonas incerta]
MSKKRYKALGQSSLAFEACSAVLSRGTQALPQGARLWQARGLLELQQGRTEQARGLLEKAVELDPKLAPVLNWKNVRAQEAGTE